MKKYSKSKPKLKKYFDGGPSDPDKVNLQQSYTKGKDTFILDSNYTNPVYKLAPPKAGNYRMPDQTMTLPQGSVMLPYTTQAGTQTNYFLPKNNQWINVTPDEYSKAGGIPTNTNPYGYAMGGLHKYYNAGTVTPDPYSGEQVLTGATPESAAITEEKNQNNKNSKGYNLAGTAASTLGNYVNVAANTNLNSAQKNNAYGQALNQTVESVVGSAFPVYGQAYSAVSGIKDTLIDSSTSHNINPETGEKAYKQGTDSAIASLATPTHTKQIDAWTKLANGDTSAPVLMESFMDPATALVVDLIDKTGGKDQYSENQKLIDKKNQEYKTQQEQAQQAQQDYINQQIQSGIQNYYQPQNGSYKNGGKHFSSFLAPTGMYGKYADGGKYNDRMNNPYVGNPTGEIEKQEVVKYTQGGIEAFNLPSHEQATQANEINMPNGSQILSDRLKTESGKTFAKEGKKFDTKKEEAILKDPNSTAFEKQQAKMRMGLKHKMYDNLFAKQESLKQSKVQAYANKLGIKLPTDNEASEPQGLSEQSEGEMPMASYGGMMNDSSFLGSDKYPQGGVKQVSTKDSLYIEDKLKKDPYLSDKYGYHVVNDKKQGDILYRTFPNGKQVPVNYSNMKEVDRLAYKLKIDRDLQKQGKEPIYNIFEPQTDLVTHKSGGIHIAPSKRGTFTAAATKHGKSVQGFASQVLAHKENYSPAMVKKANFARNAAKWHHPDGGIQNLPKYGNGSYVNGIWVEDVETPESTSMMQDYGMNTTSLDALVKKKYDDEQAKAKEIEAELAARNGSITTPNPYEGQKTIQDYTPTNVFSGGYSTPEGTFDASGKQITGPYGQPLPKNKNWMQRNQEGIMDVGSALAQSAPYMADLVATGFGKKYDKENYGSLTPSYMTPDYTEAKRIAAGYQKNLREAGPSKGEYMNNLLQARADDMQRRYALAKGYDTANVEIANKFAELNKNLDIQGRVATEQNKARSEDVARQALRGLATTGASAYRDYKSGKMDMNTAKMIGSMFTNYKLDMNNPNDWAWVFKKINENK